MLENAIYEPTPDEAVRALVSSVFRDVWNEFCAWEELYSRRSIASLPQIPDAVSSSTRFSRWPIDDARCNPEHATGEPATAFGSTPKPEHADPVESFTFLDFTEEYATVKKLQVKCLQITEIEEYPVYESCTPLAQNILHGDDSEEMSFIPFADDPSFDIQRYLSDHKWLKWQGGCVDPDISAIVLETAKRLHFLHVLTIDEIDATGILPQKLRSSPSHWGAIWTGTQNDQIPWPTSSSADLRLADVSPPREGNLQHRIADYLSLFCPKLSCTQALCPSHNDLSYADLRRPGSPISPIQRRHQSLPPACGPNCHRVLVKDLKDMVPWSESKRENLLAMYTLAPAASPCELAVLCREPCWQVSQVLEKLPRHSVVRSANNEVVSQNGGSGNCSETDNKDDGGNYSDDDSRKFVPGDPCTHTGPCDEHCPCVQNKAHCMRECRCGSECSRRWQGCRCGRGRSTRASICGTDRCPCKRASRECDPNICDNCNFKERSKDLCRNSQIQRGEQKHVKVAKSTYGLGVFLEEPAREGDLISEYIGELIYEPTFDTRGQLSDHRGRSYVFQLNPLFSNDSTYAGNVSRFCNGTVSDKTNCVVGIPLVNGEHRIGVYAQKSMSKGTELLLDYGPEFYFTRR